ncbi:tetraspanin-19 isoform X2 [Daucus carota subsp. sativus]|uniref:tetraspanin-19 isoform X2 n=1 Tax=Daucus carota subsp. sativus TaxID=79200 RepID=UPI00308271CF
MKEREAQYYLHMFIHFNGENSKDLPSTIPEAFQLYCGTGSLWLIRVWQSYMKGASPNDQTSFPWFVHAYISLGISFCAITCLGIFVAHTAYSHFLSCVPFSIPKTLMMAHLFLSLEWEKIQS